MAKLTDDQKILATEWWIGHIKNADSYLGESVHDTGLSLMHKFLQVHITEEQVDLLTNAFLEVFDTADDTLTLSCDYNPCAKLCDILEKAGVPLTNVPYKTYMYFENGKVLTQCGYGKPTITLK